MEKDLLDSQLSKLQLDNRLKKLKDKTGLAIQSILFPKKEFTLSKAKEWASNKGYKTNAVKEGDKFIHLQQKKSSRFNTFRTIMLGKNIKARVAGNMTSKFAASIQLKGLSKFSDNIKSDLDIKIPMNIDIEILCEGENRDGNIKREDLEESLGRWGDLPIIDFHDESDDPTAHKISDRKGYTRGNTQLVKKDNRWWVVVPAIITDRGLAYQLYLKNLKKQGKPLEVSAEYGWQKYWDSGKLYQINLTPHIISVIDRGHIEGNKLVVKGS